MQRSWQRHQKLLGQPSEGVVPPVAAVAFVPIAIVFFFFGWCEH